MGDSKTIRIYEEDWLQLAAWQAELAQRDKERPSFADLVHAALVFLELELRNL